VSDDVAGISPYAAVGIVSQGPNEGWVPRDVVGARKVFNLAAPHYRAALSHYQLARRGALYACPVIHRVS
jgi:hypothetical protein